MTSTEAPSSPADPLPVFVPPSVMDPVSNLDLLPVDDAFALELRAERIEQLVGGDALRRGVSERIEAGRSQTNADLVAGRDRVRVHATLHEHTGHGFAEQSAHLHTTVDGRLDVHAGREDTGTLAAGCRAVGAPATTLDAADGLTGARRVSIEALVDSVDARVAEGMGESGTVVRAEHLPEFTRSASTAEQLEALQETLRMVGTDSASGAASAFRAPEARWTAATASRSRRLRESPGRSSTAREPFWTL